jgi:hypothetical protein
MNGFQLFGKFRNDGSLHRWPRLYRCRTHPQRLLSRQFLYVNTALSLNNRCYTKEDTAVKCQMSIGKMTLRHALLGGI